MRSTWSKLVAAFCVVSMLVTMPGISVCAADFAREDFALSCAELPDEVEEAAEPSAPDAAPTEILEEAAETVESAEADASYPEDAEETPTMSEEYTLPAVETPLEESVGAIYTVGNGVQASFYPEVGNLVLFNSNSSTSGTLWSNWLERAGIDRDSVKSISVRYSSNTPKVKLPVDSNGMASGDEYHLFGNLHNLTDINLTGFDTSNVTNMRGMFQECSSLKTIDLSSFNTSKVTDMSWMFYECKSLTAISLSGLNMSNVTTMQFMFENCESLKNVNLSGLNMLKLTNIRELFYYCRSLEKVNLNGLKTPNVTDMSYMFGGCESLKTLDLRSLNTSKVTDMTLMFQDCLNLTRLDLSSFKTENVKYADRMFRGCAKLKYLDLYDLDLSKADTQFMFKGCNALDILITPAKVNKDNIELPHTMYDRNGKKYDKISGTTGSRVLGRTKALAASIRGIHALAE